jgi:integrase
VGTPIEPRNLVRHFEALCKRAGIRKVRFHDLRHTCASLLLAQGVEPRVIMDTLGHTMIGTTLNLYTHVLPATQRDAADRMDDVLRKEGHGS